MATDPTGYISIPLELIRGMSWKRPVRAATTGNITLSGTQTIDGVACIAGDRVLAKAQTTGSQCGIYVVAAGAWTRAFDMDQDLTTAVPAEESLGAMILVLEGTTNGGTVWRCTNTGTVTLGTTTLTFSQFGAGSSLTIKDEGSSLATAATSIDFVGPGITASGTTAAKTVTLAVTLDNLTDVVITSAVTADRLRFDGTNWVNSAMIWRPVMVLDPTSGNYLPVTASGDAVMTEAA